MPDHNTKPASKDAQSVHTDSRSIQPAHVTAGKRQTALTKKQASMPTNGPAAGIWYAMSALVIGVDQLTKAWAEASLVMYDPVAVIAPILSWTLAYNTGAAFSFLAGHGGWQTWFFSALAVVMSVILSAMLWRSAKSAWVLNLGLAWILGGAIGNLIDRLQHGHVIDFIHVHYADVWHYPIFNVADMAIVGGVMLVLFDMFFLEKKRS